MWKGIPIALFNGQPGPRQGKGFGFVRFKTEWDANRAIKNLNGRVVCGRRIGVQVTKELNRNIKYSRPSKANRKLEPVIVNQFHERGYWKQRQSTIDVEKKNKEQVWIEEEGGLKVVKIADSLASSLKQEVRDSYMATVSTIEASVSDVQEWFLSKGEIQVEVKRINWSLFWIMPASQEDFSKLAKLDSFVDDCLIRRLDR